MRSPKLYVSQLEPNTTIETTFLVTAHALAQTKYNTPFLNLTLADRTGQIEARVWDDAEQIAARCALRDIVRVKASVVTYQGIAQLKVIDLDRAAPDTFERRDFLLASRWPAEQMFEQLVALLRDHVQSPQVAAFLDVLLADEALINRLKQAPAATSYHHNYLGGLLEHVLSMARMACLLCDHYARYYPGLIDRDLVLAGCILHDLGKCDELAWEQGFEYTTLGQLMGHIPRGIELIEDTARRMNPAPPPGLLLQLKHLVLSHHGKLEYGSPVRPRTPEALLLHELDMIDSRINMCAAVAKNAPAASIERPDRWTEHHRALETRLFLGSLDDAAWRARPTYDAHMLIGPGAARDAQDVQEPQAQQERTNAPPREARAGERT